MQDEDKVESGAIGGVVTREERFALFLVRLTQLEIVSEPGSNRARHSRMHNIV